MPIILNINTIKALMEVKNLRPCDIANQYADIHAETLYRMLNEKGNIKPQLTFAYRIAQALNTKVENIIIDIP